MNKAKAYRELQRRQNKIHKLWSDGSGTQSVESNVTPSARYNSCANTTTSTGAYNYRSSDQNSTITSTDVDQHKSSTTNGGMFAVRRLGQHQPMISFNKTTAAADKTTRPLSRARVNSRVKQVYAEPGRPITAPEASAYATLDGPREEVMVLPAYTKARSVISDTESLNRYAVRRASTTKQMFRKSVDMSRSIDISDNRGLLSSRSNRDSSIENGIRYPTASKMREMLAHDGQMPYQRPSTGVTMVDGGQRSIMKRGSTYSIQSKPTPTTGNTPTTQRSVKTAQINNPRANQHNNLTRVQSARQNGLNKQVSFLNNQDEDDSNQPLALTKKNLDLFNNMVLKTIRTAKFDERIVLWINERQCDGKKKLPQHDTIPEVDELALDGSSHGRATPQNTKRDSKTLCHTKNISSNNTVVFAYSMDQATGAVQDKSLLVTQLNGHALCQQSGKTAEENRVAQNGIIDIEQPGEKADQEPSDPEEDGSSIDKQEPEKMSTKTTSEKDEKG